uniref:HMG box domain-containing protein n=1 Tax=Lactuca sativa TaxID=4236 RepID=A0A9R1WMQ3_LACSA|nr:hypothetical protein LSAT_V11C100025140 [Lactuca sativa]
MKGATNKDTLKPVDDKKVGKKKAVGKGKAKGGKAEKDPNKPKGLQVLSLFSCIEGFKVIFKKENPNIKVVSAEEALFESKATKRKSEYEKLMNAYNNKQDYDADEEANKSKYEVDEESG